MQYLNLPQHKELLKLIARCERENLQSKLETALAIAVKVDGQVDAYQVQNKVVCVSLVSSSGNLENYFMSAENPPSKGLYECIEISI